ncbi:hypothetical protein B0H17DRAFT_1027785 [Mycena rosella]|uniref:Uncharacterized protein n=1 Tax=Mycena rosella TaxID=1033263 RepID=A0AAD7H3E6_MYCRO|nr:hypothetical protein B0H17DRAFT_1027785 [Mycena rosella]
MRSRSGLSAPHPMSSGCMERRGRNRGVSEAAWARKRSKESRRTLPLDDPIYCASLPPHGVVVSASAEDACKKAGSDVIRDASQDTAEETHNTTIFVSVPNGECSFRLHMSRSGQSTSRQILDSRLSFSGSLVNTTFASSHASDPRPCLPQCRLPLGGSCGPSPVVPSVPPDPTCACQPALTHPLPLCPGIPAHNPTTAAYQLPVHQVMLALLDAAPAYMRSSIIDVMQTRMSSSSKPRGMRLRDSQHYPFKSNLQSAPVGVRASPAEVQRFLGSKKFCQGSHSPSCSSTSRADDLTPTAVLRPVACFSRRLACNRVLLPGVASEATRDVLFDVDTDADMGEAHWDVRRRRKVFNSEFFWRTALHNNSDLAYYPTKRLKPSRGCVVPYNLPPSGLIFVHTPDDGPDSFF